MPKKTFLGKTKFARTASIFINEVTFIFYRWLYLSKQEYCLRPKHYISIWASILSVFSLSKNYIWELIFLQVNCSPQWWSRNLTLSYFQSLLIAWYDDTNIKFLTRVQPNLNKLKFKKLLSWKITIFVMWQSCIIWAKYRPTFKKRKILKWALFCNNDDDYDGGWRVTQFGAGTPFMYFRRTPRDNL